MTKYGFFGGSFDPFHTGHLSIVNGALESGAVDELFVVPAGTSPFKSENRASLAPYRYYMTCEVLQDIKACRVLPTELLRSGISYTIDTVKQLKKDMNISPNDQFFLLCGTDILLSFEKWYKVSELLQEAELLIASRPGVLSEEAKSACDRIENIYPTKLHFFPTEHIRVSSSEVKKLRDFHELPECVIRFIQLHDLYPEENPLQFISEKVYEKAMCWIPDLFSDLSRKRMLHSLNVALQAVKYARKHQLSPDKAFVAGLLHDCTKGFSIKKQRALAKNLGDFDREDDAIIHALAGAYYAKIHYGVENEEILQAIYYHTIGRDTMTPLEKIVFLADKLEPARNYSDLTIMRKLAFENIDEAMILALQEIKEVFAKYDAPFHSSTQAALDSLTVK